MASFEPNLPGIGEEDIFYLPKTANESDLIIIIMHYAFQTPPSLIVLVQTQISKRNLAAAET
jgi:hypothetical protein